MRIKRKKRIALLSTLLISSAITAQFSLHHASPIKHSFASPLIVHGPKAILSKKATPNFRLFTCQQGLTSVTCYDPYQIRTAYGFNKLISAGKNGKGKTIVIIDAFQSPNIVSQLNTFNSYYRLTAVNHGTGTPTFKQIAPQGLTPFDPNDSGMVGWAMEISLDVEWSHAMAPMANIVLELAEDDSDTALLNALNDAINNNRGNIISMSFGFSDICNSPSMTAAYHQAFINATNKGITLFASAGDTGAAGSTCDGLSWLKATSHPASDPLVTSVGGTQLTAAKYCLKSNGCNPLTDPTAGTYQREVAWNEIHNGNGTGASGGGFSAVWTKPFYQVGVSNKQRGVPDVSYSAAVNGGVITYLNIPGGPSPGFYIEGGTSAGSPQWSALVSIADQVAGRNFGFINAALYLMNQSIDYPKSFHDISKGNNSVSLVNSDNVLVTIPGYSAAAHWDPVTGIGTPMAVGFVTDLPLFWSSQQRFIAIGVGDEGGSGYPSSILNETPPSENMAVPHHYMDPH